MTPGYYRITSGTLALLSGQTLIGPAVPANAMTSGTSTNAAIITGAATATATSSGGYWQINATAQGFSALGTDSWAHSQRPIDGVTATLVTNRDQVFIDDFPLWQVNSQAALDAATPYGWPAFYWNYGAGIIYMRVNPTGKRLEVCKNAGSLLDADNATVRNVIIEKSSPAVGVDGSGAAMVSIGTNGVLDNCIVRCSHSAGVAQNSGSVNSPSSLLNSTISQNGLIAVSGGHYPAFGAGPVLVDKCLFVQNNIGGWNWAWEGVMKWNRTGGFVFRNSWVHDNYGPCLWVDGFNINWLFEENVVEDNYAAGAELELGHGGTCKRNAFYRNGFWHPSPLGFASGVHPANSSDVKVFNNIIENNVGGAVASQDSRIFTGDPAAPNNTAIRNLEMHDNYIYHPSSHAEAQFGMGYASGLVLSGTPDVGYFGPTYNNRWFSNEYHLGNLASGQHFRWNAGAVTWAQWRAAGQDVGSTAVQI